MTPIPATPRWIGVDGLAVLTVASLASCAIAILLQLDHKLAPFAAHASTAIGLLAGGLAGRTVLVPSRSPRGRAILVGLVAGPIAATAISAASGAPLVRGAVGLVLGPILALGAMSITHFWSKWRVPRPLDFFDRALVTYGFVLLLASVPTAFLQAAPGEHGQDGRIAAMLGAVFLAAAFLRDVARRRWLDRIVAKKVPGWSLADTETKADDDLPSYVGLTPGVAILTYESSASPTHGPFRGGSPAVHRLARLDPPDTRWMVTARAALSFVGLAGALAVVLVPTGPYRAYREDLVEHSWVSPPRVPTPVPGLDVSSVTNLAVAHDTACVRYADGTARCWGNQAGYVLGSARDDASRHTPELRRGLDSFETMAVGFRFMCALRKVGESRALCWGLNMDGELGDATAKPKRDPIELGPPNVTQLALGGRFTLALTKEGTVHRWGPDPRVERSSPTRDELVRPALVEGLSNIVHVAAGESHACAIDRAGDVYCWGEDVTAARSTTVERQPMTRVLGLSGRATALALGPSETWVRIADADGHAKWWGWGHLTLEGQAGYATDRAPQTAPQLIPASEQLTQVRLAHEHGCALGEDGSVACWRADLPRTQRLPPGSALELAGDFDLICARGRTSVWCWRDL